MISAGVLPARRRAWRSRIRRTKSTACSLVAFMCGDLPWREDVQSPIAQFNVGRVEQPNLLQAHDVLEVPADQRVDLCVDVDSKPVHFAFSFTRRCADRSEERRV